MSTIDYLKQWDPPHIVVGVPDKPGQGLCFCLEWQDAITAETSWDRNGERYGRYTILYEDIVAAKNLYAIEHAGNVHASVSSASQPGAAVSTIPLASMFEQYENTTDV